MVQQVTPLTPIETALQDVLNVQLSNGNWNNDPYMHGMANGMLLMYGMVLNVDVGPHFKDPPRVWGSWRHSFYSGIRKSKKSVVYFFAIFSRRMMEYMTGLTFDRYATDRYNEVGRG